jgi:hypothetical protein
MEHIFNIAINMDDERIKEAVAAKAEKEIMANLTREVGCAIFERSPYYDRYRHNNGYNENCLNNWSRGILEDFIKDNKDKIIAAAAKELADRLVRTKAGKAILENLET